MPFPHSDKTPEHNPKSPPPGVGYPPPRLEGSDTDAADLRLSNVPGETRESEGYVVEREFESMKEARMPTQESPKAETSHDDLNRFENMKEKPIQESESAKNSITDTPATDEEIGTPDKEARTPTQETTEAEKSSLSLSEFENVKERPFQESEDPKSSVVDTPTMDDKFMKETPVQESEGSAKKKEGLKDQPERHVRHVYQEGDLKEFIKDQPLQETGEPSDKEIEVETGETRDGSGELPLQGIQEPGNGEGAEGGGTKQEDQEEFSEGKPLQESASSNVESESWKGPTQETMPAGKGPFEETDSTQGSAAEETRQIKEGEKEFTEGKPVEESTSTEVETESSKEEALPTQETMPAGKGPFEETGKGEGTAIEETRQITEVEKVSKDFTEGKAVEGSTSFEVETESCTDKAFPTQETMAADKGPFEETWFEMGLKRQPTDEQE